ncbi:ROK family protein [Paenibacillus nanensis]|uniref:ROK family protein n=1 Tax=Paenibacillus nanensis TaxID=393251 RepID=A0A3A1VHC5_9BACL|nr:ROK family protein [Paenibacillus nanensis]RIX59665.1 ROK family protein [Paenibacillus nanensis]
MGKYAMAFDVGGSFIKSAALDHAGHVVPGTYGIYPAKSNESKDGFMEHLVAILHQQTNRLLDRSVELYGVGYAFPGPFDYAAGISYISGTDKFERLYGVNIREELLDRLRNGEAFECKRSERFRIVFENDANLFALGEWHTGYASLYSRVMFLTIGTGAGSAFVEEGKLITDRDDVPPNGWIYNQPFGETVVDDYISKRGILRLAEQAGIPIEGGDIRMLADSARSGDATARGVFRQFGRSLGEMLTPYVRQFRPEAVVMGGQIAKSKDLFEKGIFETLTEPKLQIRPVLDTSLSAFAGVAHLLRQGDNQNESKY